MWGKPGVLEAVSWTGLASRVIGAAYDARDESNFLQFILFGPMKEKEEEEGVNGIRIAWTIVICVSLATTLLSLCCAISRACRA